jgi:prophage maintenance system killer protein/prophage antirepressor-like protein
MTKKSLLLNNLAVYQAKNGAIELKDDVSHDTIWATQADIIKLFEKDQSVISRHISNIFKNNEIDRKSNMQKMHITNSDKPVLFYSLDVILAVGYRTNSKRAVEFRKWATQILKQHITQGYTINPKAIKNNYQQFLEVVDNIKQLIPGVSIDNDSILDLVTAFADTWLSLDAYDKEKLVTNGATKRSVNLTAQQIQKVLMQFKDELIRKDEATEFFAQERQNEALAGIIGNVMQSFGGQQLYASLEEKAAHLLYFIIKNHPFVDGNKRSGAFIFLWFIKKVGLLDKSKITPPALTALAILVAESNPKNKDRMINLVLQLLK